MKKILIIMALLPVSLSAVALPKQPAAHPCGAKTEAAEPNVGLPVRVKTSDKADGSRFADATAGGTARQGDGLPTATLRPHVVDYAIAFSTIGREAFNLRIDCAFTLLRGGDSTVTMRFGGDPDYSVRALRVVVTPHAAWRYDAAAKTISFILPEHEPYRIRMRYIYCNFTSALLHRDSGCELWEPAYDEFYYPQLFGDRCAFDVNFELPGSMALVGGYPVQEQPQSRRNRRRYRFRSPAPLVSHSGVFALLDTACYRKTVHVQGGDSLHLWLMRDREVPALRIEELHRLTNAATAFFETCLGPYDDPADGIAGHPVYVFHGNGYSNRNDLNMISASQEKFATKPHLLPLVHEIGHRWLGEWTLLIPDGADAAYFLKESLNEYMTLLYVRASEGEDTFRRLLEADYLEPLRALRGTPQDECLIALGRNINDAAVYIKGPVLLDRVASRMGYDRWIAFMRKFYRTWCRRPGLTYRAFVDMLAEQDPGAAQLLDSLVHTD